MLKPIGNINRDAAIIYFMPYLINLRKLTVNLFNKAM